jgi:hypothetical protein
VFAAEQLAAENERLRTELVQLRAQLHSAEVRPIPCSGTCVFLPSMLPLLTDGSPCRVVLVLILIVPAAAANVP